MSVSIPVVSLRSTTGYKLSSLRDSKQHPYNPDIANAFFRAGDIEARGQGIQRVFDTCRAAGTPPPRLDHKGTDLWTEFPYSPDYLAAVRDAGSEKESDEKWDEKLGETRASILRLMASSPRITVTELGKRLSLSRNAVDKNIQILKRSSYIRRIGPAKGGHWEVLLGSSHQNHPSEET